jgi:uncharacterized protein (DUF2235 family)
LRPGLKGLLGSVDDNIRSAYQFIAQNYVPGDEIYLFGFSRGAFTARSLAGLITACGICFASHWARCPTRGSIIGAQSRTRRHPSLHNMAS